jgi:hypothetical protein
VRAIGARSVASCAHERNGAHDQHCGAHDQRAHCNAHDGANAKTTYCVNVRQHNHDMCHLALLLVTVREARSTALVALESSLPCHCGALSARTRLLLRTHHLNTIASRVAFDIPMHSMRKNKSVLKTVTAARGA